MLEAPTREVEPRSRRGLLLNRALELTGGVASALDGEIAGDVRRWCDSCEQLAVACAAADPKPVLAQFTALPQVVALVEEGDRRALGVTVEGVPIELVVAEPELFGTALIRATGSSSYVAALEPLPDGADEDSVYDALGVPWCPRSSARSRSARSRPPSSSKSRFAATSIPTRRGRTAGRA